MKAVVDEGLCTGCGLCADSCPDVFEMEGDKAIVKGDVALESRKSVGSIVETTISPEVKVPQNALLWNCFMIPAVIVHFENQPGIGFPVEN